MYVCACEWVLALAVALLLSRHGVGSSSDIWSIPVGHTRSIVSREHANTRTVRRVRPPRVKLNSGGMHIVLVFICCRNSPAVVHGLRVVLLYQYRYMLKLLLCGIYYNIQGSYISYVDG